MNALREPRVTAPAGVLARQAAGAQPAAGDDADAGAAAAPTGAPPDPACAPDVLVRFAGVEKTYDGVTPVVERLDLDVLRGEFLTLLGPSGSGKTTTLMMLAGFEAPTAGEIVLDGRSIAHTPPHRREVGMVFQNYALFPHLSVAENVAFPLTVRRVPRREIEARVARALAMVRLSGFGERRPGQLSGGQQQRVAFARALVYAPKLVLMDEPLGALDKQLREQMQLELRRLHGELDVTIVYVTHDQSEALTLSDRIAVFHRGRIRQLDVPDRLYEQPADAFVARFIGENNQLPGRVERVVEGRCTLRLACGASIDGLAAGALRPDDAAVASVRPERISVGPAIRGGTSLDAALGEVIYLGDHLRLRVSVEGLGELAVKMALEHAASTPPPGGRVTVSWNVEHCRVFPVEQE